MALKITTTFKNVEFQKLLNKNWPLKKIVHLMIQIILSKFLSIIYIYCTVNYNKTLHPTPHSNPFLFTKVHVI